MTHDPYHALLEIVVDLVVLLEAGADEHGLPASTCADTLERLYGAFDELPADGRHEVLRTVARLSLDERRGPNRLDRLVALDGLRASLAGR